MDMGLRDRVAVVTGASRGIGREIALALAAEGCRVLLCARDRVRLDAVAAEIGAAAAVFAVDVTRPSAAGEIVAQCHEVFGRIDILVNNAGGGGPKPLADLSADDWADGLELNFLSAARLATVCGPAMAANGWGRMVHVASISGREPDPFYAPYSAAKAALLNLSTSLSRAFAKDGVLSNCVVPGVTMTELVEENAAQAGAASGRTADDVIAATLKRHDPATKRFGTTAEVAAAVVFLCSEPASWITGATLEVDGGTRRSV